MVVKAWDELTEDMIAKSFVVCGQTKHAKPEDVSCMKEGRVAAQALEKVKEFWNYRADQFESHNVISIDIDESEDMDTVDVDSSDDELE